MAILLTIMYTLVILYIMSAGGPPHNVYGTHECARGTMPEAGYLIQAMTTCHNLLGPPADYDHGHNSHLSAGKHSICNNYVAVGCNETLGHKITY